MITLSSMADVARELVAAEAEVDRIEANLSKAKERARTIREETIPGAMLEMGLKELKLATGEVISIKQEVYPGLNDLNREAAFEWLEAHNHGALIKTNVVVAYGKGELEKAYEQYEELKKLGLNANVTRDVHYQTLAAFLREQLRNQTNIPLDVFNARATFTTTIKKK